MTNPRRVAPHLLRRLLSGFSRPFLRYRAYPSCRLTHARPPLSSNSCAAADVRESCAHPNSASRAWQPRSRLPPAPANCWHSDEDTELDPSILPGPHSSSRSTNLYPVLREIPNSLHREAILSPSFNRITNRMRSSITELSFHGIPLSTFPTKVKSVTHVSGTFCLPMSQVGHFFPPTISSQPG
jgi:hypothetical protein